MLCFLLLLRVFFQVAFFDPSTDRVRFLPLQQRTNDTDSTQHQTNISSSSSSSGGGGGGGDNSGSVVDGACAKKGVDDKTTKNGVAAGPKPGVDAISGTATTEERHEEQKEAEKEPVGTLDDNHSGTAVAEPEAGGKKNGSPAACAEPVHQGTTEEKNVLENGAETTKDNGKEEEDGGSSGDGGDGEEMEYAAIAGVRIIRGPSISELEKRQKALEKWSTLGPGRAAGAGTKEAKTLMVVTTTPSKKETPRRRPGTPGKKNGPSPKGSGKKSRTRGTLAVGGLARAVAAMGLPKEDSTGVAPASTVTV